MASSSSNKSQKHVGSKYMEIEEIVKYMSNLPSYLERGKPIQDRALNFGVLDWGRLEQWQYHHQKQSVIRTNKFSPSGSNSTDKPHHVTLQSHLNISPQEISTKDSPLNHSGEKKTTNRSRIKPRDCKKNDFYPQNLHESKLSDDLASFYTASSSSSSSSSKGKMKIQDEIGNFQDSSYGHKNLVLNGEKFEEINSGSKKDIPNSFPFVNETVNGKNAQNESNSKRNPRKHHFRFSMSSKPETTESAVKTLASSPISQNSPEDSKIKAKVKMDLGNCKEVKVDISCRNIKDSSSRKQALFQMAIKNGRPLFTFSVDNNNDVLAATVRSLNGKDDISSWIYTFFTIHEVKKKTNGWLYHKDKGHGYLPDITAQMKVTNSLISDCTTREFVLSSVDSGQPVDQILDVHLENELAANVVRFLRKEDEEENQDCFSMTVILPGGHHGVPRKGEPSPLIERWRSGGRCDCGGWDVGCRLRTLTNKVQSNRRSNPPEDFDLFLEGDIINERPFFSFSPIKEGIFSVEYNSSLPLLHAFSICISVIECRKSSRHTYVAKQVDDDAAPVAYASLPPVSPVGRV